MSGKTMRILVWIECSLVLGVVVGLDTALLSMCSRRVEAISVAKRYQSALILPVHSYEGEMRYRKHESQSTFLRFPCAGDISARATTGANTQAQRGTFEVHSMRERENRRKLCLKPSTMHVKRTFVPLKGQIPFRSH